MQGTEARLRRGKKWPQSKARNGLCIIFTLSYGNGCSYHSAGAPGIPLPAEGTITAFLSSVRVSLISKSWASRSASSSVLSGSRMSVRRAVLSASGTWQWFYTSHDRINPALLTIQHTKKHPKTTNKFIKASPTLTSPQKITAEFRDSTLH